MVLHDHCRPNSNHLSPTDQVMSPYLQIQISYYPGLLKTDRALKIAAGLYCQSS